MMAKIQVQLDSLDRSKNINPPKTTKIARRGIMELMPSAAPRLVLSVESVSQALKAASLAVEPKKVMTQSRMMTKETPTAAADVAMGKRAPMMSVFKSIKLKMEMHQRM